MNILDIPNAVDYCTLCQKVAWYGKYNNKYAYYDRPYLQELRNWGHNYNPNSHVYSRSVFSEREIDVGIEYGLKDYIQNSNWQEESLLKRIETFKNIWGNSIWGHVTIITLIREGVFTEIPYDELRKFSFRNKPKRYYEPLVCTDCLAKFINEKNEEIKGYLKIRNSPEWRRQQKKGSVLGFIGIIIVLMICFYDRIITLLF